MLSCDVDYFAQAVGIYIRLDASHVPYSFDEGCHGPHPARKRYSHSLSKLSSVFYMTCWQRASKALNEGNFVIAAVVCEEDARLQWLCQRLRDHRAAHDSKQLE